MPPSGGVCRVLLREAWTNELRKRQAIQPMNFPKNNQKKKDPKLFTPSLTRHLQIKDLPEGFASRFIQDQRRRKVFSNSDIDVVGEFSLPKTAAPRPDPTKLLSLSALLGLHPSPSIVARARDSVAGSLFSSFYFRRKNSKPFFVGESRNREESSNSSPPSFALGSHSQHREELCCKQKEGCSSPNAGESFQRKPSLSAPCSLSSSSDVYVELSRLASASGFRLLHPPHLPSWPSQQSARPRPKRLGGPAERGEEPKKKTRQLRNTKTLRRLPPESVRWREEGDTTTLRRKKAWLGGAGVEGWKDDRDIVREVYRHHISVERGRSMSPFSFSVDPEE